MCKTFGMPGAEKHVCCSSEFSDACPTVPLSLPVGALCYRQLVESSPDAVYVLVGGRCVFANAAGLRLFQAQHAQELLGHSLIRALYTGDAGHTRRLARSLLNCPAEKNTTHVWLMRLDGSIAEAELSVAPCTFHAQPAVQVVARDVTAHCRTRVRAPFVAFYDPLTGLPNRVFLRERLTSMLKDDLDGCLAVLLLDIDQFNEINSMYGHAAGDQLLSDVAQRMRERLRAQDIVVRISGDEFGILFGVTPSGEGLERAVRDLLRLFAQPFTIAGQELHLAVSAGVAGYPADGKQADDLLQNATLALHRAKAVGDTCLFYSHEMCTTVRRRRTLADDLRRALVRDELEVYYQPQLRMRTMTITGVEALSRWRHEQRGTVSPTVFIPVAEDSGLIESLDEAVMRTACARVHAWNSTAAFPLTVAVNLSPRHFRRADLAELVARVLHDTRLAPEYLELEITEGALMENVDRAMTVLRHLADRGVRIAIDDFGTGYSSLSYLKKLPVHRIKIARAFVEDLLHDPDDEAIVAAIIALSHTLNRDVLAEGVESLSQLDFLRDHACNAIQGDVVSPPLPWADLHHRMLCHDGPCRWSPTAAILGV